MNPFPTVVRRTADSANFFDMAARGEVMLRRCLECEAPRGPQELVCPACHHTDWTPTAAEGSATLLTWTVVHRSPVPGLDAPYTAALVECREGPWMFVRLLDAPAAQLHTGLDLELVAAQSGSDGDNGEFVVAARPRIAQEG